MGLIEGFADYVLVSDAQEITSDETYKNFQMKFLMLVLLIKLLMIFIVSKYLWPRFVPKVFSGAKSDPGFTNLFGVVVICYLLF